jgi:hypothetical protein
VPRKAKFYLKKRRKTRCAHHFIGTKRTWDGWNTVKVFDGSQEAVKQLRDTKIRHYEEAAIFHLGVKMVSKVDDPDRGTREDV